MSLAPRGLSPAALELGRARKLRVTSMAVTYLMIPFLSSLASPQGYPCPGFPFSHDQTPWVPGRRSGFYHGKRIESRSCLVTNLSTSASGERSNEGDLTTVGYGAVPAGLMGMDRSPQTSCTFMANLLFMHIVCRTRFTMGRSPKGSSLITSAETPRASTLRTWKL